MRSVVDRNVIMQHMPVQIKLQKQDLHWNASKEITIVSDVERIA